MAPRADIRVVAHFLDGSIVRGTTIDFSPVRSTFRLSENEVVRDVRLADLKAVFFVREFAGDPSYEDKKGFFARQNHGKKVMVEFHDGEVLYGYTLNYSSQGFGFFVFPGDPGSNNEKIFVIHAAARLVKLSPLTGAFPTAPNA